MQLIGMQLLGTQAFNMQPLCEQTLGRQLFGRRLLDMQPVLAHSYDSLNKKVRKGVHKGLVWRLVKSSPGEPFSWPKV